MEFTAASVVPALATLAAAFVAGGIARSNLIVSKESKISEFRQAWGGDLRENLSSLFSAVRLLARAVQEEREMERGNGSNPKFHFSQEKIVETRQLSSETKYRIELLLDANQDSHVELRRLLDEMMTAQYTYLSEHDADIELVFAALGRANEQATVVLAQEWEKVRLGEPEYRGAVSKANTVLLVGGVLMLALVAVAFFSPSSTEAKPPAPVQQVSQAAPVSNAAPKSIPTPTAAKAPPPQQQASQTSPAGGGASQTVAASAVASTPAVKASEAGAAKK
jgi:hypothetical protein